MFGSLVNALKGIGTGALKGIKKMGSGMMEEGGGFDWGKLAEMGESFSSGVKAIDPNSQLASIGEGLSGGIRKGSQIRANRAIDRMRNAQYSAPVELQPELPDAPLTPPTFAPMDQQESALERLKRGGYRQTF